MGLNQRQHASADSRSSILSVSPIATSAVTKFGLRIADCKVVDGLAASSVNHLFHVRQQYRALHDGRLIEAVRATVLMWPSRATRSTSALFSASTLSEMDYEAEAQVSIQPLQINLDQVIMPA